MEKESIWFKKEADDWNEAFPIGNGFFGAMVFGKTGVERIISTNFCKFINFMLY